MDRISSELISSYFPETRTASGNSFESYLETAINTLLDAVAVQLTARLGMRFSSPKVQSLFGVLQGIGRVPFTEDKDKEVNLEINFDLENFRNPETTYELFIGEDYLTDTLTLKPGWVSNSASDNARIISEWVAKAVNSYLVP